MLTWLGTLSAWLIVASLVRFDLRLAKLENICLLSSPSGDELQLTPPLRVVQIGKRNHSHFLIASFPDFLDNSPTEPGMGQREYLLPCLPVPETGDDMCGVLYFTYHVHGRLGSWEQGIFILWGLQDRDAERNEAPQDQDGVASEATEKAAVLDDSSAESNTSSLDLLLNSSTHGSRRPQIRR